MRKSLQWVDSLHVPLIGDTPRIASAVCFIFIVAMFLFSTLLPERAPVASSETRFVETSQSGMLIVPASCPSVVTNPDYPHNTCSVNSSCPNGLNIANYPSCTCPSGQVQVGDQCASSCPSGYTWNGTQCVAPTCPAGYLWNEGQCQCQSAYYDGDTGVWGCAYPADCPVGYTWDGVQCIPTLQCTPSYFCGGPDGDDRWFRSGQCLDSLSEICGWGCLNGQCLPAPSGTVNIWTTPVLVRSENRTLVQWEADDVTSCTVNEDNTEIDDSWSGTEMGCGGGSCTSSHQSSGITRRTKYTLTCTGLDGQTYTDTATVNIVPVWIEN